MCDCGYVYRYVFYICACVFNVSCAFVCMYMDVSICVRVSILVNFYSAKDLSPSLSLLSLTDISRYKYISGFRIRVTSHGQFIFHLSPLTFFSV